MCRRLFDIMLSLLALAILLPAFLAISLVISLSSPGGVFYRQKRVGKHNKDFSLLKFRTMKRDSDKKGLLTIGRQDPRVTATGRWLRKHKLDELPQLINILAGDMSFVGPRPEVRKYVEMYTGEQKEVLTVRPGLTDLASIQYINENELLAESKDPEKTYIEKIMPDKLKLNLEYIRNRNALTDLRIILITLGKILR
ncbi:MAG: sugar transferase [Bacteroidales bacterium]